MNCRSTGTGGTMTGVAKKLKEPFRHVQYSHVFSTQPCCIQPALQATRCSQRKISAPGVDPWCQGARIDTAGASLEYHQIMIYIYIWWPPPKTYVFYKKTAIYSVSRTFWPLDFGSVFGVHHMYNINKIHNM